MTVSLPPSLSLSPSFSLHMHVYIYISCLLLLVVRRHRTRGEYCGECGDSFGINTVFLIKQLTRLNLTFALW